MAAKVRRYATKGAFQILQGVWLSQNIVALLIILRGLSHQKRPPKIHKTRAKTGVLARTRLINNA
jgi:hypothetical protein